jgi:hypothetical protein
VRLARFGLAAKGIVYVLVGVLAIQVARGQRGTATDAKGALQAVADEPFGSVLVGVIGFGLLGYVFWRIVQAISDTDGMGTGAKGLIQRGGQFLSGLTYAGISFFALSLLSESGSSQGAGPETWTARLLSMPLGQWWVFLVAAAILAYGVIQLHTAYRERYTRHLALAQMNARARRWTVRLGKIGHAARGIVFLVIGGFLLQAAAHANPDEARGVDGALNALARQPHGAAVLGIVAAGLAAYGAFQIVEARYRHIRT